MYIIVANASGKPLQPQTCPSREAVRMGRPQGYFTRCLAASLFLNFLQSIYLVESCMETASMIGLA
jgi:hypothetical protein